MPAPTHAPAASSLFAGNARFRRRAGQGAGGGRKSLPGGAVVGLARTRQTRPLVSPSNWPASSTVAGADVVTRVGFQQQGAYPQTVMTVGSHPG
ncbi:MAG: hypothetical protein KBE22_10295 [Candidatus Accumulibacter sp.]|nr:hypothetical protein [Accumulibacter sp.]